MWKLGVRSGGDSKVPKSGIKDIVSRRLALSCNVSINGCLA